MNDVPETSGGSAGPYRQSGPASRFERIRNNPAFYPGVVDALGPAFPWHTHAGSPRSSQALCLSAWFPLAGLEVRQRVVECLVTAALPAVTPLPGRRWRIAVEVGRPELLGERGGRPSSVDVLLVSDDAVVCVESKYLADAAEGFGRCGQFPGACRGFYGPGSDAKTGTAAPCRLELPEGGREPRRYWRVAARLFRDDALRYGGAVGSCPLHRHYQLARNLFVASELARVERLPHFGALGIAPEATAATIERQTTAFTADVLRPEHAGRVAVIHYERLVELLQRAGDEAAAAVGHFVAHLLPTPPARPRTRNARELARRARAALRAGLPGH